MHRSAIILASGTPKGFNEDKGTLLIDGKPLIKRVVDAIEPFVDETIVVVFKSDQIERYKKILPPKINFVIGSDASEGTLSMAISGLEAAKGEYSLILPFDSPFVSVEVAALLFDLASGKTAVIPRSPNNEPEPLHAVYYSKQVLEIAKKAINENQFEVEDLIDRLRSVRYVSTMVIEQLDPDLKNFFRIKTPLDLKKASVLSKPRKTKK